MDKMVSNFNSIKVRLKLASRIDLNSKQGDFNSIKVRLKLLMDNYVVKALRNFNSIKVRLKLLSLHLDCYVSHISIP